MKKNRCNEVLQISLHDKHKCDFCRTKAETIIHAKTWLKSRVVCLCHQHSIDWNNNKLDVE